jgi:hypothetical protein
LTLSFVATMLLRWPELRWWVSLIMSNITYRCTRCHSSPFFRVLHSHSWPLLLISTNQPFAMKL